MKLEEFQLLEFKYDDKGLVINYVLDPGGVARAATVGWSKTEHNIPNSLIKSWRDGSMWIAAIEGRIPAIVLEDEFGSNNIAHRNKVDQLTKLTFPENQTFSHLFLSDYSNVARMHNPVSLKLDAFETGVQFGYEFKYLDYKGNTKRKTPVVCISHDKVKEAAQLKDKFKFAIFPWYQELAQWLEGFIFECYKVAKKDAEAKAAYSQRTKQMTIDDVTTNLGGKAPSEFDNDLDQEIQQGLGLNG